MNASVPSIKLSLIALSNMEALWFVLIISDSASFSLLASNLATILYEMLHKLIERKFEGVSGVCTLE